MSPRRNLLYAEVPLQHEYSREPGRHTIQCSPEFEVRALQDGSILDLFLCVALP